MMLAQTCASQRSLTALYRLADQPRVGQSPAAACAIHNQFWQAQNSHRCYPATPRSSIVLHASTEQPKSPPFSLEAAAAWLLYAGYLNFLLFSPFPPGEPAINPDTAALAAIGHESLNLFYLNIWLDSLQLAPIPSIAEHPVSESIFNIIMAWNVMLLPAILSDRRSEQVPKRYLQWTFIVSIWTFALMPYMAQRAATEPLSGSPLVTPQGDVPETPGWQKGVGAFGFFIGVLSLGWFVFGRPEYGDISERMTYFSDRLANQRVFGGFLVDLGIYWLAQWLFMSGAGASRKYCAVPFFGLGAWLVAGKPEE